MTNDEIIKLASEVNSIVRTLDQAVFDDNLTGPQRLELNNRLAQIFGQFSGSSEILLLWATRKMLEGRRCGGVSDNPETMRRLDSIAADIGARREIGTTLLGESTIYERRPRP